MSSIKLLFLKGQKSIVEKNGIKKPGQKPGCPIIILTASIDIFSYFFAQFHHFIFFHFYFILKI